LKTIERANDIGIQRIVVYWDNVQNGEVVGRRINGTQ